MLSTFRPIIGAVAEVAIVVRHSVSGLPLSSNFVFCYFTAYFQLKFFD
jgi:hypothetical protein